MQHFFEGVGKARFYRAIKKCIPLKFSSKEGERKTYYIIQIFIQIETSLRELQVYLGSLLYFKNRLSSKIQAYMQILNKNSKAMTDWFLS